MTLASGTRLGVCEIVGLLGAGGMGEVYRASDARLGRDVALKVLSPLLARDPALRERFEREAHAVAGLDHPNIVTVHSFEQAGDVCFITMQLVEGEPLANAIPRGGMPLQRLLDIGIQLADAIGTAHERGIIHRDLKPANVIVGSDDRVRVLDFGLAKLREHSTASAVASVATQYATAEGLILGTVAYMSPEQAEGREIDQRTDVFSLGVILYEMSTGRRPFDGDTPLSTLTAILRDSPPEITAVNARLPTALSRTIRRCLAKDPRRRYQNALDLRNDFEDLRADLESSTPAPAAVGGSSRPSARVWALTAVAVISFAAGVLAPQWFSRDATDQASPVDLRELQLTANPRELPVYGAAISPDGGLLAFTDSNGVFLRLVNTGETNRLPIPAGTQFWEVAWFPDGTRLLLTGPSASGESMSLYSVPVVGGTPRKLQDDGWRAAVSPDGSSVAFLRARYPVREVWVMGANGERPTRIVEAGPAELVWQVGWSPDGKRIAYGVSRGNDHELRTRDLDAQDDRVVLSDARLFQSWRGILPFVWLPDGRLVYARSELAPNAESSNFWEQRIDARGTVFGEPKRLTANFATNVRDARATLNGRWITFLRERIQPDVYVAEWDASDRRLGLPQRLTMDDRADYSRGAWGPDSRTLFFESNRGGTWDLFRQHLDAAVAEPVVIDPESDRKAVLSPDGTWVLFERGQRLMRIPIAGGPAEQVLDSPVMRTVRCAEPPAARCVVDEVTPTELTMRELDPIRGAGRAIVTLPRESAGFVNWDLSRDGTHVALVDFADRIRLVRLGDGLVSELKVPGWTALEFIAWTADGSGVFATAISQRGPQMANTAILHVDLQGRVRVVRHEPHEWHVFPVASPDGRYLAFSSMIRESNAWQIVSGR